jgi:capsular exopolysaccharide synthesis family protein
MFVRARLCTVDCMTSSSFADIWLCYRRWAALVSLCVLVVGAATYAIGVRLPKIYQSTATVLVAAADSGPDAAVSSSGLPPERVVSTYAELLKSRAVVEAAIATAGAQLTYDDASRQLDITPRRDAQLIQVTAHSTRPVEAAALANAVVQTAIDQGRAAQADRLRARRTRLASLVDEFAAEVATQTRRVDDLRAQPADGSHAADLTHAQADLARALQSYGSATTSLDAANRAAVRTGETLSLLDAAVPAETPASPRIGINVLLASVVALVVGLGAAVLAEVLGGRLLPPQLAARRTGLRLLGTLSQVKLGEPISAEDLPGSDLAEAFRHLRSVLRPTFTDTGASLLVTSAGPGEGKTTVVGGLAVALALSGKRVVVVDANLHQPRLHQLFAVEAQVGLSTLLVGSGPLDAGGALIATGVDGVWLLPRGPSEQRSVDLLASRRMRQLIKELSVLADVVLLDGPSLAVSDALTLGGSVSGVMLVFDPARTRQRQARACIARLERSHALPVGLVLNRVRRTGRVASPARTSVRNRSADVLRAPVVADVPDIDTSGSSGA